MILAPLAASQIPHTFAPSRPRCTHGARTGHDFHRREGPRASLVQTSDTKLPLAGDGSKPGPVIKSEAAAAAWNCVFERCESDLRFAVGKPGPSYDQALAIKASLEALDRNRKCSGMQFLDREGHKWSVTYNHSNKKVSVVDEGVRAESRTALSKTRPHPASRIFYASLLHNININQSEVPRAYTTADVARRHWRRARSCDYI